MNLILDVIGTRPHYLAHLLPVVEALRQHDVEVTVWTGGRRANQRGTRPGLPPRRPGPVLVASHDDGRAADGRPLVLMEHGAGQSYRGPFMHPAYAGGRDRVRDRVILFLCPGRVAADPNRVAYPLVPVVEVGCPKLDALHLNPPDPAGRTVAFAFHWDASPVAPEAGTAWRHFAPHLGDIAARLDAHGYRVVGHGHPRALHRYIPVYRAAGIEVVDEATVMGEAATLVWDNTCVAPDTPVLCADLTWRAASSLRVGDRVIGCDEERTRISTLRNGRLAPREDRRLQVATVTANDIVFLPSVRVTTSHGTMVTSCNHPWLVQRPRKHVYRTPTGYIHNRSYTRWEWVRAEEVAPGDVVAHFAQPWSTDDSRDGGWLAGLFDGEGTLHIPRNAAGEVSARGVLSVAQNRGHVLDELRRLLSARGVAFCEQKITGKDCRKLTVGGRLPDRMRLLGELRPVRLLLKAEDLWLGACVSQAVRRATVESVTDLGIRAVSALATSERTFIAGGFMAHNSLGWEFASTGRSVVLLDHPLWRPQVEHGLRFWTHADAGPRTSDPDRVADMVQLALLDVPEVRAAREAAVADVYAHTDGRAADRAAQAIRDTIGTFDVEAWLVKRRKRRMGNPRAPRRRATAQDGRGVVQPESAVPPSVVPQGTIVQVLAWAGDSQARLQAALDTERRQRKPRPMLVRQLQVRGAR